MRALPCSRISLGALGLCLASCFSSSTTVSVDLQILNLTPDVRSLDVTAHFQEARATSVTRTSDLARFTLDVQEDFVSGTLHVDVWARGADRAVLAEGHEERSGTAVEHIAVTLQHRGP